MASTFAEAADDAVAQGWITSAERGELQAAYDYFQANRSMIETTYAGSAVGVARGLIYGGATTEDVEAQIPPDAMFYVEDVVPMWPSP